MNLCINDNTYNYILGRNIDTRKQFLSMKRKSKLKSKPLSLKKSLSTKSVANEGKEKLMLCCNFVVLICSLPVYTG